MISYAFKNLFVGQVVTELDDKFLLCYLTYLAILLWTESK